MNLNSLFRDLALGELSNLHMATNPRGYIQEDDKPQVTRFVNDSLLRLYSLFKLRERNVIIEQEDHITFYHFLYKYAASNTQSGEPFKYIKDLAYEPFQEDVIRILEVRDHYGWERPLNNRNHQHSVFTPQAGLTLQVPCPIGGEALVITYQAKHPAVTMENPTHTILLPEILHVPLRLHVGYQVFSAIGTSEATAKAAELSNRFDALIAEIKENDTVHQTEYNSNTLFDQRGFI